MVTIAPPLSSLGTIVVAVALAFAAALATAAAVGRAVATGDAADAEPGGATELSSFEPQASNATLAAITAPARFHSLIQRQAGIIGARSQGAVKHAKHATGFTRVFGGGSGATTKGQMSCWPQNLIFKEAQRYNRNVATRKGHCRPTRELRIVTISPAERRVRSRLPLGKCSPCRGPDPHRPMFGPFGARASSATGGRCGAMVCGSRIRPLAPRDGWRALTRALPTKRSRQRRRHRVMAGARCSRSPLPPQPPASTPF